MAKLNDRAVRLIFSIQSETLLHSDFTVTTRPPNSTNDQSEVYLFALTRVSDVGLVEAMPAGFGANASVQTIVFPRQPGDVVTS
jgi:hypothetical protein